MIAGVLVGWALSSAMSFAWDRLTIVHRTPVSPVGSAAARAGLTVAFHSIDVRRTSAFEASIAQAEQRVRRQLHEERQSAPWLVFRSRTPLIDGTIVYLVWFEPHGDIEYDVLTELLPASVPTIHSARAWPDDELLTFVPLSTPSTTASPGLPPDDVLNSK